MKLRELLTAIPNLKVQRQEHPALLAEVKGVCTNSHACQPGDLFIGMPGTRVDGGEFWESAIASGAVAALISTEAAAKHPPHPKGEQGEIACVISASDMTTACAQAAAAFYGDPAQHTKMA